MKPTLDIFLFHGVFKDRREMDCHHADPQQEMTLEDYRQFIEFHLRHGYSFVSPEEIIQGLSEPKRHLLLTFDDGYFNNTHIVPLLTEYQIPALFFISPNYILQNKSFWWDVLYRERTLQGFSKKKIYAEGNFLKQKNHVAIELYLRKNFKKEAALPLSDIDRPFNPKELKAFSQEAYVEIGNHTCDHAILTHYPLDAARAQITQAQQSLFEMTGKKPVCFSYPNGNYSDGIVACLKEEGFKLGLTCRFGSNPLPIDFAGTASLTLKRFGFSGSLHILRESRWFQLGFSPHGTMQNLKGWIRGSLFFRKNTEHRRL